MADRQVIITGNWKMYKTAAEAVEYVKDLIPLIKDVKSKVYLAVPFTAIREVAEAAQGTAVNVGAQNMNDASEGAFTGEIAGKMLVEAGARFVLLGHSERRHLFGESNELVNRKVKQAQVVGLQPVLCVGETLEQREQGRVEEILRSQIEESLVGIEDLKDLVLAYEPVWAIGTGHTATPSQADEAHQICRTVFQNKWGKSVAENLTIQYGGSVKPANAKELLDQPNIDGLLVGGASLTTDVFSQIVNAENKVSL